MYALRLIPIMPVFALLCGVAGGGQGGSDLKSQAARSKVMFTRVEGDSF